MAADSLAQLSATARRTVDGLEFALPEREFNAVRAWLTTFRPYQLEWLLDWSRFALLNKARQIGASHTYGAAAVLWGLFAEPTVIVSVGEREALDVLDKARRHAEMLRELGSKLAFRSATATTLRLESGARIMSVPSTSAARGHSSNVLLDEVAYYQHPEQVWDSAAGAVMHGYRIRCFSTPNGVGNFWHSFWTDPTQHAGYVKHQITLEDALSQGLAVDMEECWRMARGNPRVFDQLFRCSFLDNADQYIPTEAINACSVDNPYAAIGDCYAGLDVGLSEDPTALVIVKQDHTGTWWEQHTEVKKPTTVEDLDRLCAKALAPPFSCRRVVVDATGLGAFPARQLQQRHGVTRVELVNFTLKSKEALATGLYELFCGSGPVDALSGKAQQGKIRIRKSNTRLRDELCSLRRIVTEAGNVRYDAPRNDKGHADLAWALALACHGGLRPTVHRSVVG